MGEVARLEAEEEQKSQRDEAKVSVAVVEICLIFCGSNQPVISVSLVPND
jgi:hypothetical protein